MIPKKVVRQFIAELLIRRGRIIDDACEEMMAADMQQNGLVLDTSMQAGWEACGIRVLADDILSGYISVEEAIANILDEEEIGLLKNKCIEYSNNSSSPKLTIKPNKNR